MTDRPQPPALLIHFLTAVVVLILLFLSLAALSRVLGALVLAWRWFDGLAQGLT